jgi:hypothetical protein
MIRPFKYFQTYLHHSYICPKLKPRFNLRLRILQRPLTPRLLTPHRINLFLGEALRLRRRVVSEPRRLRDLLVRHIRRRTPITALVHGAHDRTTKPKVMLQRNLGVLDGAVVRPAAQMPHELRALRDTSRAEGVAL